MGSSEFKGSNLGTYTTKSRRHTEIPLEKPNWQYAMNANPTGEPNISDLFSISETSQIGKYFKPKLHFTPFPRYSSQNWGRKSRFKTKNWKSFKREARSDGQMCPTFFFPWSVNFKWSNIDSWILDAAQARNACGICNVVYGTKENCEMAMLITCKHIACEGCLLNTLLKTDNDDYG